MRYLRYYCIIITLLLTCASSTAQQRIRSYWETAPDFSSVEKDLVLNVLDSLDLITLPHQIYGELKLLSVDSTHLSLQTSAVGTWSLQILPTSSGKPLLGVIRSVSTPIADSNIAFYTDSWVPMEREDILQTIDSDLFIPFHTKDEDAMRLDHLLYPLYLSYSWLPMGHLEIKANTPILLDDETREQDKALIEGLKPVVFHWRDDSFILAN